MSTNKFRAVRRQPLNLSQAELVKTGSLPGAAEPFPLVLSPGVESVNLTRWAGANRERVEQELLQHGALLFRGFEVGGVEQFEEFARALSPDLLDYRERAAPRVEVGRNIYTSTEYPAEHHIPLHHEMSYSHNWPTKIWFYCVQAPRQRGATPVADDRKVFRRLSPQIKEPFMRKKVMYTRNYGEGVDLSWQEAFQTTDRALVEKYCREAHTEFEWKGGDRLKTRQVRQAVAVHPKTGETVWFNHAHMFHISNVEPDVRAALLEQFREEDLPRNAYYGDGTPIETSVLDEIREIYREEAVTFPWQEGDIMMLDNFLATHGREPFVGPRKIVVAMAELYTNRDI
ncbi:MAG TPA: TauD/TfdA family dioxygenase [Pyrinomonadaceae bacterium]|nr:TauD/TfdA family dioxygenase [Pyrinomonadaceae bacterium]